MTLYRLQATLQHRNLLPRDVFVNTICVEIDPAVDITTVGPTICADFGHFYETGLIQYLSDEVKTASNTHHVKLYRHEGLPPHPPLADYAFSLGTPGASTPLPEEVACCLSFRTSLMPAGTKPASARGRIYLGPLNVGTMESLGGTASQGSRPTDAFRQAVVTQAQLLATNLSGAGHSAAWVVASPTTHRWAQITEFRVDDAWDTQRSRGRRPGNVFTGVADASNGGPATGTWVPTS